MPPRICVSNASSVHPSIRNDASLRSDRTKLHAGQKSIPGLISRSGHPVLLGFMVPEQKTCDCPNHQRGEKKIRDPVGCNSVHSEPTPLELIRIGGNNLERCDHIYSPLEFTNLIG